jgi:sulfate permease, SulP family
VDVDRSVVAAARRWVKDNELDRHRVASDAVAGVPGAISSVPDGMAASVLAGVSPVHGLFASFAGPIAGGFCESTRLMVITTTSAAALAAGSALATVAPKDRPDALFLLTVLAGVAMIAAGLLHLGRYTRFVSYSVMLGFLTGIATNILLSQFGDLTGVASHGETSLARALDVVRHARRVDVASVLAGAATMGLAVVLRTRRGFVGQISSLVALAIPSLVVGFGGLESVARVGDQGSIPGGFPVPQVPRLHLLSVSVVTGALAVAAIVLVQGAGVSENVPNTSGPPNDVGRDFVAQGAGNIAAGLFTGQPVGGSVGQTALNVSAGARTRAASIFRGVWMLVILVAFSGLVSRVAMPTLAAILIIAAVGSLKFGEIQTVWRTGWSSRIAMLTTFVGTLFLSIQLAVGLGVALSALLQLNRDAMDLSIVELVRRPDGKVEQRPASRELQRGQVTVLDVYGSLFFAGVRTLEDRLPAVAGADRSAVVLRLRGRTGLGATFFRVVVAYAAALAEHGSRLYLSGVEPSVLEQIERVGLVSSATNIEVFAAATVLGDSSERAVVAARSWIDGCAS